MPSTTFSQQDATCASYGACDLTCANYVDRGNCEGSADCVFACGSAPDYEICSDGLDNDVDGFVDCDDSDCQVTVLMSLSDAEAADYNCLGSSQMGNVTRPWYCGVARQDESVGLCCEGRNEPGRILGSWRCGPPNPCDPALGFTCDYYYDSQFSSWISSVGAAVDPSWCVAPADGRACCSVVHFAELEYWDDEATENVKVY